MCAFEKRFMKTITLKLEDAVFVEIEEITSQ
jgi:hypothetical protein